MNELQLLTILLLAKEAKVPSNRELFKLEAYHLQKRAKEIRAFAEEVLSLELAADIPRPETKEEVEAVHVKGVS